ncbi:TolC family protein [Roseisolibacter sp. H3M3-2]|uniref:efflux transporter outer membrane subunit n=1 Tax=Roseisolibacter sp. H3M3-2 TaxID=3031323 RepID=UPI0023DC47E4|nr:TolC family protein [Roseisolibacter sp. H3M3-2]MDF1503177.1 TolC family protein [Roseisolibacter sp. H3M3-2]
MPPFRLLAAAAALALALPARAQQPAPQPAPLPGTESPLAFWESLGDPALAGLLHDALRDSRDAQGAVARVRGARAARTHNLLDLAPAVTASAGYTRQRLASASFPVAVGRLPEQAMWDAGLRATWEVDVFGQLRRGAQAQGALADAAHADLRSSQVLLASELAGAYFELRGAQERLAVARRNADNQRQSLAMTETRLEGGRGTALDTERARAQLSATLAEIPALEAVVEGTRHRMAALSGRGELSVPDAPEGAAALLVFPETAAPPADAALDALVRRRPDVQGDERRLAASRALVGAARAAALEGIAVGAASGYTGRGVGTFGDPGTPRYVVGPVVSWPALDMGRVRAGVDAARAVEEEARARYEGAVLRGTGEVRAAHVAYAKSRERLALLDSAAAASERAARLARLRFAEGASDFLPVLDAERTLLEAQDRRALGRSEASARLVAVYRTLGGAWRGAAR